MIVHNERTALTWTPVVKFYIGSFRVDIRDIIPAVVDQLGIILSCRRSDIIALSLMTVPALLSHLWPIEITLLL